MSSMKNFLDTVQELLDAGCNIVEIQEKTGASYDLIEQAIEYWTDYAE